MQLDDLSPNTDLSRLAPSAMISSEVYAEECDLVLYIHNKMLSRLPSRDNRCRLIAHKIFQLLAILAGPLARIPFLNVPLKYGGDNKPYGIVLAIGNTLSFGSVISWCLLKLVASATSSLTEEERRLVQFKRGRCCLIALKIGAVATGVLSRTPFAYLAYHYNDNNILYTIPVLLIDSAYPIYSIALTGERILERKKLIGFEKKLAALKIDLINCLRQSMEGLAQKNPSKRKSFLAALKLLLSENTDSKEMRVKTYVKALFDASLNIPEQESPKIKHGRFVIKGISLILGLFQCYFIHTLSYAAALEMTNDPDASYAISIPVTASGAYLGLKIITSTCVKTFNVALDFFRCRRKTKLPDIFMPRLKICLSLTALVITGFSYAPPMQVCEDFYEGDWRTFMQVITVFETIAIGLFAIMDLLDEFIEVQIERVGDEEAKQLVMINHQITELIFVIEKSPMIEFAKFVKIIPEECSKQWTDKLLIQSQQLQNYIAQHE